MYVWFIWTLSVQYWLLQGEIPQQKGSPWSGCLIHPLPRTLDASPKLLRLLRAFGMEELLPVFLFVEIRTDNDFDLFSYLDEEGRLSVFNLIGKTFRLRPFQRMMLEVVIRGAGINPLWLYFFSTLNFVDAHYVWYLLVLIGLLIISLHLNWNPDKLILYVHSVGTVGQPLLLLGIQMVGGVN